MSNSDNANSSSDEREIKRKKRSSGGIMNFVGELFWRQQQEEEEKENEVVAETEEEEDDDMELNEEDQGRQENEIIVLDDEDEDDATVPEEDGDEESGDEEEENHFPEEQNLTQLTPTEAVPSQATAETALPSQATTEAAVPPSSIADDSSVHNTELGDGDDEGHETISNAPSDFENQLNASNLQTHDEDHEQDGEEGDDEGLFYKGQLIHKMSYRDLGRHLKALGLRAVGKQHVLRSSLIRAVKKGMEAPDDVQSQASTVEPRTPKRKRSMESPPSSRVKRSSRIQTLQAGSVRVPTRLASARKTQNSQKDSYLTTPAMLSPHHHNPAYTTEKKPRRRSTRRKGSRAHAHEDGEEVEEDESQYEASQTVDDTPRQDQKSSSSHHDHDRDHEDDPDSELDGFYSPVGYNPEEKEAKNSTPHRLPEPRSLTPEVPSTLPRYESTNKFDYEDLTDSVSLVETASVAATNGSALSPVQSFSNENGPLSTMPLDHLPPPQRYPQYLERNRNTSTTVSSGNGGQHIEQRHTTSQQSDDDVSSIVSYPEPHSSFSPPASTPRLHENRSRGSSSSSEGTTTPFDDALGAVGNRFVAMLRGGEQLSDAEYSFFKTLLESKRPPGTVAPSPIPTPSPPIPTPSPPSQPQAPQIVAPSLQPVEERNQIIEVRKATAVDTSVQTEDEDYERKKRTFSETDNSPPPVTPAPQTREEEPQSNKRRKGSSPPSVPQSYPPFQISGYRSPATESEPDREWMAPRRHSFLPSHPIHLPRTPLAYTPRSEDSFYRPTPPAPQSSLPMSLQVQHQSLSQSNQTAAISSVQRRLMRRRTTFQSSSEEMAADSRRSSANGVVAKRILDTLGEITATLDEQRQKSLMVSPTTSAGGNANNRVRFVDSTPHSKQSNAGLSVRDRIATPKASAMTLTPSPPISTPNNNFAGGRDSVESAEPLWTRERGRTGGPSMSPPMSFSSSRNTTPVQGQPLAPKFSQVKDSESDEFTFNAPKDIEGLEDEVSYNLGDSSANKQVRFVFSPPAKKISKKFPPTPGGPKLRPLGSAATPVTTKEKVPQQPANASEKGSSSSLGLPESLVKRPNSVKCPACMVFNDKAAERCVACETKLPKDNDAPPAKTQSVPSTSNSSNGLPDFLTKRPNSVKCPVCMVFNDKAAERCVACESKLTADSSTSQSSGSAPSKPTAPPSAPASSGFSFGGSSGSGSGVTFGSKAPSSQPSSTLSFGASSTTPISFGKSAPVVPKESDTSSLSKPPTSGISFGSSTPGLTFGSAKPSGDVPTPASGLLFGASKSSAETPTAPAPASSGFSFGSTIKPSSSAPSTTPSSDPSSGPKSFTGFSFGSATTAPPSTAKPSASTTAPGLSFGSSPPTTTPTFGAFGAKAEVSKSKSDEKDSEAKPSTSFGSLAGKSFTGFGSNSSAPPASSVTEEAKPKESVPSFQSFHSTPKPSNSFGSFSSATAPATPAKDNSDGGDDRGKKRQAFGGSEQPSTKPAAASFSFGGNSAPAPVVASAPGDSKPAPFAFPATSVPKFGSSNLTATPFGQSTNAVPAPKPAAASDVPKSSGFSFGSSSSAPFSPVSSAAPSASTTPGPFGKFGTSSSSAPQPFGQSAPMFGSDPKSLTRASSVATPPPPPPMGSESPGNMDTGYGGDTSSIPSSQLPPPSASFGASPFSFGGNPVKSTFPATAPSPSPFGGFGGSTPSQPQSSQPFAMFGGSSSGAGSGPAFGSSTPSGVFGSSAPAFGSSLGGMGAQPFGQPPTVAPSGGGAPSMFNMGVPEKSNQSGPKGRRKVKPTWKPA